MLRPFLLAFLLPAACASCVAPSPTQAVAAAPGEVDYSCRRDDDCAVKNVGNCCGYYPACVNAASSTYPELVMERCRREGLMAVCGFPQISACVCVEGRCEAVTGGGEAEER